MNGELVPLGYAREAFNTIHGTDLQPYPDYSSLSPEQAAQINSTYDIEVVTGVHGIPNNSHGREAQLSARPTPLEYDEAAGVANRMEPGDVLFHEGYGFTGNLTKLVPDNFLHAMLYDPIGYLVKTANVELALIMYRQGLEKSRLAFEISAFEYATGIARAKRVATIFADHDAFDSASLTALTGNRSFSDIHEWASSDPNDAVLVANMRKQRAKQARNIMISHALNNPPAERTRQDGRKPRLLLLFGEGHAEDLREAFGDLNLDVTFTSLASSMEECKAKLQIEQTFYALIGVAVMSIIAGYNQPPSSEAPE